VDATLLESLRRDFRAEFPREPTHQHQSRSDRIRRSLSWGKESFTSPEGSPTRFVKLWIALNALYGQRHYEGPRSDRREQKDFEDFVAILIRVGGGIDFQRPILGMRRRIRGLITNPFLWNEYWRGEPAYRRRSRQAVVDVEAALREGNIRVVLHHVFARLMVLRNQIIHGSAAADTLGNRGSVIPAIRVLEALVPVFVQVMIRRGRAAAWPPVPYPRVDTPLHPSRRSGSA